MFFGKGILFSRKNMIVPAALNFHERGAKDIPQAGEEVHPGSPVCTLLSCGATYEDTLSRLIGQAELLEEQIYG
jgi:predicted ATP-grasp superfamily ATP-dependent carboligase